MPVSGFRKTHLALPLRWVLAVLLVLNGS